MSENEIYEFRPKSPVDLSIQTLAAKAYHEERRLAAVGGQAAAPVGVGAAFSMQAPARGTVEYIPAYKRGLKAMNGEELLEAKFPARSLMLSPWLPDKGLAMVFAPRGVGKTWFGLSIAHAIASGSTFLRWHAPRPRRVLYLDGEMPAGTLQARYAEVIGASNADSPAENFRLVASDFQPDGLPDLADADAQRFFDAAIGDAELIIVDNLSTIARGLRENEADSFGPVQVWLLAQRAAGRSVLVIHHAGKGGGQRGTSRKEDTLDTLISLSRPPGYLAIEGARFEVRFTKSRGFWGEQAEPFEAKFADGNWMTSEILADDSDTALFALRNEGLSVRDIAERSGLPKSTVARRLKDAVQ
jgi:RecA-family ATPase